MKFLLPLILLTSIASAAPLPVVICDGRLTAIYAGEQRIALDDPFWRWEGHITTVTVSVEGDTTTIFAHIDVLGPEWLDVTLIDDGIDLYFVGHDSTGQVPDAFAAWSSYEEMNHDPSDLASIARSVLRRCGGLAETDRN